MCFLLCLCACVVNGLRPESKQNLHFVFPHYLECRQSRFLMCFLLCLCASVVNGFKPPFDRPYTPYAVEQDALSRGVWLNNKIRHAV